MSILVLSHNLSMFLSSVSCCFSFSFYLLFFISMTDFKNVRKGYLYLHVCVWHWISHHHHLSFQYRALNNFYCWVCFQSLERSEKKVSLLTSFLIVSQIPALVASCHWLCSICRMDFQSSHHIFHKCIVPFSFTYIPSLTPSNLAGFAKFQDVFLNISP